MRDHFSIGGRTIGPDQPPFVVAEVGMNHNGDLDLARDHVEAAADAGADAVKFQTYETDAYFSDEYGDLDTRREYELRPEWHRELKTLAAEHSLAFLSTPFDRRSVELLDDLEVPCYKIASFDVTNHQLIRQIAEKGEPIILSTGYSTHSEIAEAVEVVLSTGNDRLALLHCISSYPTPLEWMNVSAVETLADAFGTPVGLSDHTHGSHTAAVLATAMGASVIEKHFTIDNDLPGYDHAMSETPETFSKLTTEVRNAHEALGDGDLSPLPEETDSLPEARRTLHWRGSYEAGTEIAPEMFLPLRPGGGLPVKRIDELAGRRLGKSVEGRERVQLGQIDWDED
ncbi:N-acetylneuraminate synthase family protein [Halosimplex salinum]|uniref:N-acetylneuraminate synthase family protein n=1 Tax=Halosimplex salinum TaxID=1710538 RepID=UPI000F48CAD1|nr:N-acetylneuraminate synthase family protein [Halosimplex salinum]